MAKKNYAQLKAELEDKIEKLSSEELELEKALLVYKEAQEALSELEEYLTQLKKEYEIVKKQK